MIEKFPLTSLITSAFIIMAPHISIAGDTNSANAFHVQTRRQFSSQAIERLLAAAEAMLNAENSCVIEMKTASVSIADDKSLSETVSYTHNQEHKEAVVKRGRKRDFQEIDQSNPSFEKGSNQQEQTPAKKPHLYESFDADEKAFNELVDAYNNVKEEKYGAIRSKLYEFYQMRKLSPLLSFKADLLFAEMISKGQGASKSDLGRAQAIMLEYYKSSMKVIKDTACEVLLKMNGGKDKRAVKKEPTKGFDYFQKV